MTLFFPWPYKNGFLELWPNALRYGPEIFTEGSSQKVLGGLFFLFSKFDLWPLTFDLQTSKNTIFGYLSYFFLLFWKNFTYFHVTNKIPNKVNVYDLQNIWPP